MMDRNSCPYMGSVVCNLSTHLIVRLEHRHHDVNCDEPIGVHGTHVIADELVVGDSHHHENQKVETKHHPQQAEQRVVLLYPEIREIT